MFKIQRIINRINSIGRVEAIKYLTTKRGSIEHNGSSGAPSKAGNCEGSSSPGSMMIDCSGKPTNWPTGKRANYHFHGETESILNEQINAEFKAFYYYLSMAGYFGRVDVALPGCESFFLQMHHEEHDHAIKFFNYVKRRGGCVKLGPIVQPDSEDWKCPLYAFKTALQLEIEISEKLQCVNSIAEKHGDLNASDYVITCFMDDQMRSINEMARLVSVLSGIGDSSLGRFMFDKDLLDNYVKPQFNVFKLRDNSDSGCD